MPILNLTLLENKYCPECLKNKETSKLVQVAQEWHVDDEDHSNDDVREIILEQCPCGYANIIMTELPFVKEPSEQELAALRGIRVSGYRFCSDFSEIHQYFAERSSRNQLQTQT